MIWSKLKRSVEGLMASSVKEHLQLYYTHYGPGDSYHMVRAWITWDGEQIDMFSNIQWWNTVRSLAAEISGDGEPREHYEYFDQAKDILEQRGHYSCEHFLEALEQYVLLSIDDALRSPDVLIRAWSMFDKRLGKRRLHAMRFEQLERRFEQRWYQLRCQAEGIHNSGSEMEV